MKRRRTEQFHKVQSLLHLEFVRREGQSSSSDSESETEQVLEQPREQPLEQGNGGPQNHEDAAGPPNGSSPSSGDDGDSVHDDSDQAEDQNNGGIYDVVYEDEEDQIEGLMDDNGERFQYIADRIKKWAMKGVAFTKVDELLKILRPIYPNLPKSYRTLLETPRDLEVDTIGDHQIWYKGIETNLHQRINDEYFLNNNSIKIDVFIDSFSPYKANQDSFWAILGCLVDEKEPFIIQMCRGNGHPPLQEFFENFVNEANNLQQNGFLFQGQLCPFKICLYFADALGRAFIKCITSHTGHHGCERCCIVGYRYRQYYEVFTGPNGRPRTDESFAERRDRLHHDGDSPLETLGVNMISQIPLDTLHLVDEGCMKRWLKQVWGKYKIKRGAIGPWKKRLIQRLVPRLRRCIPSEFNRKGRSFLELSNFKAQEFRRILLYDGVRLFKHFDQRVYLNFLHLHSAITILSNPEHVETENMLQIAECLLERFVHDAQDVFGENFVSYNIHSAKHLVDECRKYKSLIKFGTYKFENFFSVVKRILRSGSYPIQQIRNRDHEMAGHFQRPKKEKLEEGEVLVQQRENFQFNVEGTSYKKIQCVDFCLATSRRDCCFISDTKEVVCITKIIHTPNRNVVLKGHKFAVMDDYYRQPIPSSMLDIYKVSQLIGREESWQLNNVKKKCILFPERVEGEFLCLPLVHM